MDSFYDAPRRPPIPTSINRIEKSPAVPTISVVENSLFTQPNFCAPVSSVRPQYHPYSVGERKSLQENTLNHDNHRKHVRFECPSMTKIYPCPNPRQNVMDNDKENISQPLKSAPDLNGKTFKQIYMANVPDRHLDLSIFEPTIKITRTMTQKQSTIDPEVNTVVEEVGKISTFTNCPTYNAHADRLKSIENTPQFCFDKEKETSEKIVEKYKEIEPSIGDLHKIIQQQNEQIIVLQRQVNNLKNSIRQTETRPLPYSNPPDYPFMKEIAKSPTKKGMYSFDVKATSFEVSFRPQHGKFRKQNDLEPKIQEITECDDSKDNREVSLHLEESLNLRDSYMSTVPSIQINMDEYHSSDEEEESFNPSITFYKDLMNQVNNVLKKIQAQSDCLMVTNKKKSSNISGQTMEAVKKATLQHLKSIGVNLSPIQEINEMSRGKEEENKDYDSNDISFTVKQLLMKYLPDDKLTQALNKPKNKSMEKMKEKKCKSGNTEFSFAAIQYMKKYNLINKKLPELEEKVMDTPVPNVPKILDVTALKLQPKFL